MTEKTLPIEIPIDGVLDLHTFDPREVKYLINDYIRACLEKNILQLRIIHGKGTGALRESVYAILARHPHVLTYRSAPVDAGGWGAALVEISQLPIEKK